MQRHGNRDGKMKHLESSLQITCVEYFDLKYPHLKQLLFHIPNGGKRNIREAARLKRMGVRAGVADFFLAIPRGGYHGLFIELKVGKGKLTDSQKAFTDAVAEKGYLTAEVRSVDGFIELIDKYYNY